jgi:PAS domain S-box-containing protein
MALVASHDAAAGSRTGPVVGLTLVALGLAAGVGAVRLLGESGAAVLLIVAAGILVGAGARVWTLVARWHRESDILRLERVRANELLQAALQAHSSMGVSEVERAIEERACVLLATGRARFDSTPPGGGELGCRLRSTYDPDRWLVVSPRPDGRPYDAEDERALELLVATTAAALDNAHLHARTAGERRLLGDIFGSSSDAIFSVDGTGVITSWNAAMAAITGRTADDAVGRPCGDVVDARDADGRDVDLRVWLAAAPRDEDEGSALDVAAARGTRRWLDCAVAPMPDGGVVVVARDVSEQREVDDLKSDFLATVSHELRTPLTPIQGFLQTLMRDDASFGDEERHRFYEVMLRQSERLERLIKDLLDATSLQDKDHLFFPERVEWVGAATRIVELFRRQDPTREFELHVEPGLPDVVVDEQRAEQVLSNLLSNAVKYSPPRAPVSVTIALRPRRTAREGGPAEVVTSVTDRGPGIDPGEREKVFERFTRLGNHLTRTVGGAGLGLFIARRLVEGMGGTIAVDSAPTGGASFSFTLPVAAAAPVTPVGQPATTP